MKERSKNQDVSSMRHLAEADASPQLSDKNAFLAIFAVSLALWAVVWIAVGMFLST
jgi:hypothetical protein